MTYWGGPALRDAVKWKLGGSGFGGHVQYEYLSDDPSWSRETVPTRAWRRVPAWAATHIRIRAYYIASGTPLDPIEDALRSIPGLVELERIDKERGDLREQVVALFERKPEQQPDESHMTWTEGEASPDDPMFDGRTFVAFISDPEAPTPPSEGKVTFRGLKPVDPNEPWTIHIPIGPSVTSPPVDPDPS